MLQRQSTPATANLFRQYKQNKQCEEEDIKNVFQNELPPIYRLLELPPKPQRHLSYILRTVKVFML